MSLIALLEANRRDFLDAVANAPGKTPVPDAWSAVECIEHVVAFEERYLSWIENGSPIESRPDPKKELRLFTMIRSGHPKLEAPESLRPCGRFQTLEDAVAGFISSRDRTIATVDELGRKIYEIGTSHPYFGKVNGAELINLIDGHTRRHADQIRETL